jgi:hypothetical protein
MTTLAFNVRNRVQNAAKLPATAQSVTQKSCTRWFLLIPVKSAISYCLSIMMVNPVCLVLMDAYLVLVTIA